MRESASHRVRGIESRFFGPPRVYSSSSRLVPSNIPSLFSPLFQINSFGSPRTPMIVRRSSRVFSEFAGIANELLFSFYWVDQFFSKNDTQFSRIKQLCSIIILVFCRKKLIHIDIKDFSSKFGTSESLTVQGLVNTKITRTILAATIFVLHLFYYIFSYLFYLKKNIYVWKKLLIHPTLLGCFEPGFVSSDCNQPAFPRYLDVAHDTFPIRARNFHDRKFPSSGSCYSLFSRDQDPATSRSAACSTM